MSLGEEDVADQVAGFAAMDLFATDFGVTEAKSNQKLTEAEKAARQEWNAVRHEFATEYFDDFVANRLLSAD